MADSIYLEKARISLAGAESEYREGRYLNVANRAYYACFQAVIAALVAAGVHSERGRDQWEHEFVQSRFVGLLINRRKLYPSDLRDTLRRNQEPRNFADYHEDWTSETQAVRALQRARRFVNAVEQGITP